MLSACTGVAGGAWPLPGFAVLMCRLGLGRAAVTAGWQPLRRSAAVVPGRAGLRGL